MSTPRSPITTHVLDTATGLPARGLRVRLDVRGDSDGDGDWTALAERLTDDDGRAVDLLPAGAALQRRTYRLRFETGAYLAAAGRPSFFPFVEIVFAVDDPGRHHHVPLLLSPFGYTTYRGS
jgi:5-hydroxyisourate hydrolase